MKCPECLGTSFEEGQFDFADLLQGRPVVLPNVPGDRCRQCGYLIITAAIAERIEQALDASSAECTTPADVYDLATVLSDAR